MSIAALFTIAKTRKQPKGPSIDEWIKKMWRIYIIEYYSAISKNEIMPFAATWMDLEIIFFIFVIEECTSNNFLSFITIPRILSISSIEATTIKSLNITFQKSFYKTLGLCCHLKNVSVYYG